MKETNTALLRCLTLLALVPTIVTVLTELNKGIMMWRLRIVDMADLVILAPFYFIVLVWLREIFSRHDHRLSLLFYLGPLEEIIKNDISFYDYLCDRISKSYQMPSMASIVSARARDGPS